MCFAWWCTSCRPRVNAPVQQKYNLRDQPMKSYDRICRPYTSNPCTHQRGRSGESYNVATSAEYCGRFGRSWRRARGCVQPNQERKVAADCESAEQMKRDPLSGVVRSASLGWNRCIRAGSSFLHTVFLCSLSMQWTDRTSCTLYFSFPFQCSGQIFLLAHCSSLLPFNAVDRSHELHPHSTGERWNRHP
mgnify:CR=1 FL=1